MLLGQDKFEFKLLDNSGQLLKDIKKLVLDGRGSNHAYAQDGLTLMSIKQMNERGFEMIKETVNQVIEEGRYPKSFRTNKLRPVDKKPVVEELKHLRPVTIGPQMAMIQEKVF